MNTSYYVVGCFINQYGYIPAGISINDKVYNQDWDTLTKGANLVFDVKKAGTVKDNFDFEYLATRVKPKVTVLNYYLEPESIIEENQVKRIGQHVAGAQFFVKNYE